MSKLLTVVFLFYLYVSSPADAANSCNELFIQSQIKKTEVSDQFEEPNLQEISLISSYSDLPVKISRNQRFGWYQYKNLLIPDRFFFRLAFSQKRFAPIENDWQPYYEIDGPGQVRRFESGLSNRLAKYFMEKSTLTLTRYMSEKELNVWKASKIFKENPSIENYNLLSLAVNSFDKNLKLLPIQYKNDISNSYQILEQVLNNVGKYYGRLFFMTRDTHKVFATNQIAVQFNIQTNVLLSSWFFGIENGYIEAGVPAGKSRLLLLDGFNP